MTILAWVFSAAVLLLLFVTGELAARRWIRCQGYYVFTPGMRLFLQIDTEVLPELEPETRFYVNAAGERGGETPRSAAGLYRVLVVGGSQPEGFFLDQDTAWPGALQQILERPEMREQLRASNVHVGSIARSGVGSEALDLILDRVLPRYPRLQLIIILVGATDVFRWLEYGAPATIPPVRVADIFRCHPEETFRWQPTQLALLEVLLRARHRWLRSVQVQDQAGRWYLEARAMRARAKTILTGLPEPGPMLDHFEFHFRRLLLKAKAHADRVLVVRQPWFDKEYSKEEAARMWHGGAGQVWREEVTTYYSFDVVARLLALLDARAASVASELGVGQLDLMPILERSLETYYDVAHVTPAGARAIATAIAAAVLQQQPWPFANMAGQIDVKVSNPAPTAQSPPLATCRDVSIERTTA